MLAPSQTQEVATRAYLLLARSAAEVLRRSPHVETVFAHRSISAREVAFGRSDIDLGLVLDGDLAGAEVESLVEIVSRFRRLKLACPVIGECLPLTREEAELLPVVDPFRGSLVRRAAIHLTGRPLAVPFVPQSVDVACERVAFWFDLYLAEAFRTGNRRNLRKLAIEIWNAKAVASGVIDEPFVARRDADAAWRASEDGSLRLDLGGDPVRAFAVSCELAGRLHATLHEPLPPRARLLVFEGRLTAARTPRTVVVTANPVVSLPAVARNPNSFVTTPEVLDLYLRYVNPFGWFEIEAEARELGIARPPLDAFRRVGLSLTAPWRVRYPGLADRAPDAATARLAAVAIGLARLEGRPADTSLAGPLGVGIGDYYRRHYTRLLAAAAEIRAEVRRLQVGE